MPSCPYAAQHSEMSGSGAHSSDGQNQGPKVQGYWPQMEHPATLPSTLYVYVCGGKREFSADWLSPPSVPFRTPWTLGSMQTLPCHRQDPGGLLGSPQDLHSCLLWSLDHPWTPPVLTCWL